MLEIDLNKENRAQTRFDIIWVAWTGVIALALLLIDGPPKLRLALGIANWLNLGVISYRMVVSDLLIASLTKALRLSMQAMMKFQDDSKAGDMKILEFRRDNTMLRTEATLEDDPSAG